MEPNSPLLMPLTVMTLAQAAIQFSLNADAEAVLEKRLTGKERRLTDGRIAYRVPDIIEALYPQKAA